MTTIAKDVAAKFAVAAVAVAMIFTMFAPAASAQEQSVEDLQALINSLMEQISALEGGDMSGGVNTPALCPYTWTRDLSQGSTGADVMKLQQFLNSNADTRVAATGAGSVGAETEYYGPATAAAVSKMQVMYRADILTPAGLVNPTGYFGPSSRAKANMLCVAAPVDNGGDDNGGDDMGGNDDDDDNGSMTLRGEASVDSISLDSEESDIEENEEDVPVAELTVEFQDGDAEISRLDVELTAAGGNDENEPWEVFETVSLWVDGDMIAEVDASDEDEYLDEDDGSIRFTGLDLVAEEDEEFEIIVAVSTMNNLDGLNDGETWNVTVESMRFFDADGVADTITDGDTDAGDLGDLIDFDLEMEGADEELNISLASNNPDSTDIVVDTDDDTNGVTIMVADLEAEENDIELDKVVVRVDITGGTGTSTVANVVDEIYVVIDGEEFDAEAVVGTGAPTGNDSSDVTAAGTSTWFVFDIDGDYVIDEDSEVEMEVVVDFNDNDDGVRYANGTQIKASVTGTEAGLWEAEGADDVTADGTAVGDEHTLVAEGILVPVDGFSSAEETLGQDDTIGEFTLEFEVTAVEDDFYITNDAALASTSPAVGVAYTVTGGAVTSVTDSLTSTADEDTLDVFTVREGETETFTLVVTVDAAAAGTFRVGLTEVNYSTNADGTTDAVGYNVTPASDFRSAPQSINQI